MEQLVLERVDSSDFSYGGKSFDSLYRVGCLGDPDDCFYYFDDVVEAYLFKRKLESKGGN